MGKVSRLSDFEHDVYDVLLYHGVSARAASQLALSYLVADSWARGDSAEDAARRVTKDALAKQRARLHAGAAGTRKRKAPKKAAKRKSRKTRVVGGKPVSRSTYKKRRARMVSDLDALEAEMGGRKRSKRKAPKKAAKRKAPKKAAKRKAPRKSAKRKTPKRSTTHRNSAGVSTRRETPYAKKRKPARRRRRRSTPCGCQGG